MSIYARDEDVEITKKFTHLGSTEHNDGWSYLEVTRRVHPAPSVMDSLNTRK